MAKISNDKISKIEQQIEQLNNRKKQEIQKMKADERKARTRRLCQRHGLLESIMPELISITDDQFKAFLEKAVCNTYGRDILRKILAQPQDKTPINAQANSQADNASNSKGAKSNESGGEGRG